MKRFLVATALASLLAAPSAPTSPPLFGPPRTIFLGEDQVPAALAAADFDGDGKLDLAIGSSGSNDVVVFFGDGRGGFRRGGSFPAGPSPTDFAVADFDRDGRLDLAIANHGTPRVTILLGDGKGGFHPAPGSPLAVHSNPHPHTIGACDIDGDGRLDLVIDSFGENRFTFLKGDGRGGFAAPGVTIDARRKPYRNLLLKDVDGDGRCDLVAPNMVERTVTILIGDGRGRFREADGSPTSAGPSPFAVAAGDLNRDGRPDLVIANYSGHISDPTGDGLTFLLNEGNGRFRLGPKIMAGRASGDVAAGDVNGDGYADAVTANAGGDSVTVALGGRDGLSPSRAWSFPAGKAPWRVLAADFDGDGRADVVVANSEAHSVTVLLTGGRPKTVDGKR